MQGLDYRDQRETIGTGRTKLFERKIFLPGAVMSLYGIWLLLTSGTPVILFETRAARRGRQLPIV